MKETKIPETTFPAPYMLTETENTIIDDMLRCSISTG